MKRIASVLLLVVLIATISNNGISHPHDDQEIEYWEGTTEINGWEASFTRFGLAHTSQNQSELTCSNLVGSVTVDGNAQAVTLFRSSVHANGEGYYTANCSYRADFSPFFFSSGDHSFELERCWNVQEGSCRTDSTVMNVIYQTEQGAPELLSIQPDRGVSGDLVTIQGSGFVTNMDLVSLNIGSTPAEILSISPNSITAFVPAGFENEDALSVEVSVDGQSSNSLNFEIDGALSPKSVSQEDLDNGFMVGEVLFFLSSDQTVNDIEDLKTSLGFEAFQGFELLGLVRGVLPDSTTPEQTLEIASRLEGDARVASTALNHVVVAEIDDQPTSIEETWHGEIGTEFFRQMFPTQRPGTKIAVIDSGVDLESPIVLSEIFIDPFNSEGLNFAGDRDTLHTAQDGTGHGTSVSAIAAAIDFNDVNGAGVAPGTQILSLRVFEPVFDEIRQKNVNAGNLLSIGQALSTAYLMGVDVINMSLQSRRDGSVEGRDGDVKDYYENILDNIESFIVSSGLDIKAPIIIAAAGNHNPDLVTTTTQSSELGDFESTQPTEREAISCPACVDRVIAVGSISLNSDGSWVRSDFSNWGPEIDLVAQGVNITTTLLEGEFGNPGPGTSFAAPQVAGLVALILGYDGSLDQEGVIARLLECFVVDVSSSGFDVETGHGRIIIPDPETAPSACLPPDEES